MQTKPSLNLTAPVLAAFLALAAALACGRASGGEEGGTVRPAPKPYRVVGGKVDEGTWRGWKIYHEACYLCHGVDATGTDVAPSLVDRVRHMNVTVFTNAVLNRYRLVAPMDQAGVEINAIRREAIIQEMVRRERGPYSRLAMPVWEGKQGVQPHLLDLYAYLRARADGALGPGKPGLLPGQ